MGDVKLGAVMGLYLGRAVAPALVVGVRQRRLRGHRADAAPRRRRAQARGPVRAVSGARRRGRPAGRRRDRRLVPGHVLSWLTEPVLRLKLTADRADGVPSAHQRRHRHALHTGRTSRSSASTSRRAASLRPRCGSTAPSRCTRPGSSRSTRACSARARSATSTRSPTRSSSCSREHKLGKSVRLGIASQRIAVRTLQLPLIEDEDELETAVRFQAQDHIPMPLDQAVLDYQVVSRSAARARDRRMDVVAVAARRDMVEALLGVMREAGLRPVGIDLSAFGMIRALDGVGRAIAGVPPRPPTRSAPGRTRARWRRWRRRLCTATSGTSPTSPWLAARPACSRASRRSGSRGSPSGWQSAAGSRSSMPASGSSHVGLERPTNEIEGDPETIEQTREALAEGAAKLADELRLSLEFYAHARRAPRTSRASSPAGPGSLIPGLVERLERELGQPFRVARPPALGTPRRRLRGPPDAFLRPRPGGVAMRAVNLIPAEERRGARAPRAPACSPTSCSAPSPPFSSASRRSC